MSERLKQRRLVGGAATMIWLAVAAGTAFEPRDLEADERCGGHTLARHVGRTDEQLAERLKREPGIAAASTYPDRVTAEEVVGTTLEREGEQVKAWSQRRGRRPNLALRFRGDPATPIGRSLRRGRPHSEPAIDALVVLRWNERERRFCVLTSYPEVRR